jgi:6-phospho-beta-glucosidase
LIVALLGGSAHSTPHLAACGGLPPATQLRLVGRSSRRLAAVARAIRQLAPDVPCASFAFDDLPLALAGADVVVIQIRVGGYRARAWDERFPHRYDSYGDEGLGAGGLAAAWRTWPVLAPILAAVARTAPAVPVLLLTSPVGILTRAARAAFPKLDVRGICELPWTTLVDRCRETGADPHAVAFSYVGVNHWGWFTALRAGERDLIDAPLPLSYVELLLRPHLVRVRQRAAPARGDELARLAERAFTAYECDGSAPIRAALARRPAPWYEHAVVPFLHGVAGADVATPVFLTTTNAGSLRWLADDDVVEFPHRASAGRWEPLPASDDAAPLPAATIIRELVAFERAATHAVVARDRDHLGTALGAHPSFANTTVSSTLIDDVVADDGDTAA